MLYFGPERGPGEQGTRHAPSPAQMAVGSVKAIAGDEKTHSRRIAAQAGRGPTTLAFGLAIGGPALAQRHRAAQPGDIHLSIAQKETTPGASPRSPLSVAHQFVGRRPRQGLGILHAIKPRGGGLQEPQRRFERATDLSSTRTPHRGAT